MSLGHNPKIVTRGLILYYDVDNIKKSWKGIPTTNLLPEAIRNHTGGMSSYWNGQISVNNTEKGFPSFKITTVNNDRLDGFITGTQGNLTNGVTYAWSADVWVPAGKTIQIGMRSGTGGRIGGSALNINGDDTWIRASQTFVADSNTIGSIEGNEQNSVTDIYSFWIKNLQLEQQGFATPFVNGTRSNTEAILDLTNNNTITANSLTHNTENTFNFNGTTDFITIPQTILSSTGSSVSAWVYIDDFATGKSNTGRTFIRGDTFRSMIVFYNGGYGFETDTNSNPHEISGRTSGNVLSSAITAGSWFHFTLVFNSGTFTGYVNGVQTGSAAISNNLTFDRIGDATGFADVYPAFFKGNISALSVYNTALTAAEVAQNFNTLKGRYGV